MMFVVVGSGSAGNCYLLKSETETLIVELGVKFSKITASLDYDLSKVVGCIVTHEHGDHANGVPAAISSGLNVYASHGTIEAIGLKNHRLISIDEMKKTSIGSFKVLPFPVKHDARQPVGFIISHPESGNILFITDTWYVSHRFENIDHVIIEANFDQAIVNEKLKENNRYLRDRIIQSHLSIDAALDLLNANDLSKVNNIVLIHLSDSNSNASDFKDRVTKSTGKPVYIAESGLTLSLNKEPF